MNEVVEVRMAGWAEMIRQRTESGLSVKAWCAENGIPEYKYYYRLKQLRKNALESVMAPKPEDSESGPGQPGQFVRLPETTACVPSETALRIRNGEMTIEVSNDASDSILALVREVIEHVV